MLITFNFVWLFLFISTDKGDTLKASYLHELNPITKTCFAAEISCKFSTNHNTFIGGFQRFCATMFFEIVLIEPCSAKYTTTTTNGMWRLISARGLCSFVPTPQTVLRVGFKLLNINVARSTHDNISGDIASFNGDLRMDSCSVMFCVSGYGNVAGSSKRKRAEDGSMKCS